MLVILLNTPQLPENTGMAMRAMVNTGIKNLRLISPRHEWPNEKAHLASAEKSDLLNIEIFDSLSKAISDLHLVFATSARRRNMITQIYSPDILQSIDITHQNVGILFGAEKDGLSNEEISLCNAIIEIPAADFSSYNLAQAVLVICYQFMSNHHVNQMVSGKTSLANQKQLDQFLNFLEDELTNKNYFSSADKKILMMQTIRNFFKRSSPTQQEIQSLFGAFGRLFKN